MSPRRRLGRPGGLLYAVLLVVGLTGCVSLPDSSPINSGRGVGVHQGPGQIRFSPQGPTEGASRQEVIDGYLRAMLAFPSNPEVVREFMSASAAATWDPTQQIQVYEDPTVSVVGDRVHLRARLLGSVDERGSWISTSGQTPAMDLPVDMVHVGGEWRITNPVAGTLMNTEHFKRYYHQFSLYFYDPSFGLITPDPVYLETGAPGATATSLVRNLLLGPTGGMAGVARSAAPAHARLTSPVTVTATGFATVALSANVASLDEERLNSLAKQLAWTLRQERVGINHMSIKVNGKTLSIQGRGPVFSVDAFRDSTLNAESSTLYALSPRGRLLRLSADGTRQPVTGPIASREVRARSVAINPFNTCAALVNQEGTAIVWGAITLGSSDTPCGTFRHQGTDLLRPSWDASGLLWLVDMRGGLATLSVAKGSTSSRVSAAGIEGLDVRAFAVSRDGMRLAAVIGRGDESRLVVGMIRRASNPRQLTPVSIRGVRPIVNSDFPLSNIRGLTWVSATTVAVLAQDSSSQSQPYQVSIDGSRVAPTSGFLAPVPISIAAAPSSGAPLVIGARDGLYVRTQDDQWTPLGSTVGLTDPAYPS